MPKLFQKLALIFLSSILFLNSMAMPFAVAHALPTKPQALGTTKIPFNGMTRYTKVHRLLKFLEKDILPSSSMDTF